MTAAFLIGLVVGAVLMACAFTVFGLLNWIMGINTRGG